MANYLLEEKLKESAPELYYAYIGIGQISQQIESERLAYEYMLEQYTKAGNTKMVQKLGEVFRYDDR